MKDHAIAYAGAGIISILLFTTILGFVWNSRNKRNLSEERYRTESLENDNRIAQEEVDKMRKQIASLEIRNDSATQTIAQHESDLSQKDKRIASLIKSNAGLNNARKEVEQLRTENTGLQNNLSDLKQEHEKALAENKELQNTVQDLESQKADITTQFNQAETYASDNFETYASRGKNKQKITAKARCAKRLNVNFDVPLNLNDSVSFKIITPDGITIGQQDKGISWKFSDPENYTAGLQTSGSQKNGKRIDLKYDTEKKLLKGEYKIVLTSNRMNIGNCRLLLR